MSSELAGLNLSEINGPVFVGVVLNWMFLGSLGVQTYTYTQQCEKDHWVTKAVVAFIIAADLAQTGATTDYTWRILVSGWGKLEILELVPRSGITLTIINPIISGTVQLFFAWRIWKLNTIPWMRIMPILITLIALMQAAAAFALTVMFLQKFEISQLFLNHRLVDSTKVWLSGNFVADILIAGSMAYLLSAAKKQSISRKTETILTKLTVVSINTGLITAVAAGLDLLFFLVYPRGNEHQALAFILGKLYSNVLLANLNARSGLRSDPDSQIHEFSAISSSARGDPAIRLGQLSSRNISRRPADDLEPGVVHVHTEVIHEGYSDYEVDSKPKQAL